MPYVCALVDGPSFCFCPEKDALLLVILPSWFLRSVGIGGWIAQWVRGWQQMGYDSELGLESGLGEEME